MPTANPLMVVKIRQYTAYKEDNKMEEMPQNCANSKGINVFVLL